MAEELAYVLINPYTIAKSRTGGVLARLLARTGLTMVGARMFSPSQELVDRYAETILDRTQTTEKTKVAHLIVDYIQKHYAPDPKTGTRKRVMMLLFKGEDANRTLIDNVVGHITYATVRGETIRDTYGDYILQSNGEVAYFEPAVLTAASREHADEALKVWKDFSDIDGGILEDVVRYPENADRVEKTLVMIKPDNFKSPSIRVGNIVDMFSKTGLYIIGIRLVHMSVAQAEEFYGPVQEILAEKLRGVVQTKITELLAQNFDFSVPEEVTSDLVNELSPRFAKNEFNKIIEFITGVNPDSIKDPELKKQTGKQTCLALVYQGIDAVSKIRTVLGSTDPSKAAPATVRKEFGQNIMINTAHASDSVENAEREISILNIADNDIKREIEEYFKIIKK